MTNTHNAEWPFEAVKNTAVITTRQVLEGADICFVSRDAEDGSYQFIHYIHPDESLNVADGRVVGLSKIYNRDPSIGQLADLPGGWIARRMSQNHQWSRELDTRVEQ